MKKVYKLILILLISVGFGYRVNAEIVSVNDIPNSSYVIGNYMFTRNSNSEYDGILTTKLIMLASTSIENKTLDGMMIYYKNARGKWIDGTTGENVIMPAYLDITNIDLEGLTTSIIYDANGEYVSNMPGITQKTIGKSTLLSNIIPSREGYEFIGWNSDKYSNQSEYDPGDEYSKEGTSVLYAIWKKKTYTVTYNMETSESKNIVEEREYGEDILINDFTPTREGYNFLGWNTKLYTSGETLSLNNNIDLYAMWKKKEFSVSIDVINGKPSMEAQPVQYGENITLKLVPDEGYSYGGETLTDCGNATINNGELTITKVNKDMSCKVVFHKENLSDRLVSQNNGNNTLNENNGSYYFNGKVENNYIMFADEMWRIMGINSDGSIRLILQNGIYSNGAYKYDINGNKYYSDANVKNVLNDWYQEKLNSFDNNIVLSNYCESEYNETCSKVYTSKIGLISMNEVKQGKDYLYNGKNYWTMTPTINDDVYVVTNNDIAYSNKESLNTIRPVISLERVNVIGDGTLNNPYIIK